MIRKADTAALSAALEIPAAVRIFEQYADENMAPLLHCVDGRAYAAITSYWPPAHLVRGVNVIETTVRPAASGQSSERAELQQVRVSIAYS